MLDLFDYLVYLGPTLGPLIIALVFRKRILRAAGRLLFAGLLDYGKETFFDKVEVKDKDGKKQVLMRPNDRFGEIVAVYGPLTAAWGMEWARRNIKIKLPPMELPEGADLKTLGMSALGQKVIAGKKLSLEDGIPLALGYVKEWAEKSGILEKIAGAVKPGVKKAATTTALTPEAQKIVDQALNP